MMLILEFADSQTVTQAEETKEKLRAALDQASDVLLDCEKIEEVDLSFIQLVLAARKSADRDGKNLTLLTPARGVLLAALRRAGLEADGPHRFWFEDKAP